MAGRLGIYRHKKLGVARGEPDTIIVDINGTGEYISIQEAINNSDPEDTVMVKAGTYYESLVINKKITLLGEDSSNTTIDGRDNENVIYSYFLIPNLS